MSKFPAQFLSASDIGKRVKVTTVDGAKITDRLTSVTAKEVGIGLDGRRTNMYVTFETISPNNCYAHELALDSWVKRAI